MADAFADLLFVDDQANAEGVELMKSVSNIGLSGQSAQRYVLQQFQKPDGPNTSISEHFKQKFEMDQKDYNEDLFKGLKSMISRDIKEIEIKMRVELQGHLDELKGNHCRELDASLQTLQKIVNCKQTQKLKSQLQQPNSSNRQTPEQSRQCSDHLDQLMTDINSVIKNFKSKIVSQRLDQLKLSLERNFQNLNDKIDKYHNKYNYHENHNEEEECCIICQESFKEEHFYRQLANNEKGCCPKNNHGNSNKKQKKNKGGGKGGQQVQQAMKNMKFNTMQEFNKFRLKCNHNQFHMKCIKTWYKVQPVCPLCMKKIHPKDLEQPQPEPNERQGPIELQPNQPGEPKPQSQSVIINSYNKQAGSHGGWFESICSFYLMVVLFGTIAVTGRVRI